MQSQQPANNNNNQQQQSNNGQRRRKYDNRRNKPQQNRRNQRGGNRQQNRGSGYNLRQNYDKVSETNQQNIPNQIRVSKKNSPTNYISRAAKLFLGYTQQEDETKNVEKHDTVIITAMGPAIPIALTTATKIRELLGGLHQNMEIKIETITDIFKPKMEGLQQVEEKRQQGVLEITLSRSAEGLQDKAGYSAPTDAAKEVKVEDIIRERQQRNHQPRNDKQQTRDGGNRRPYRSRSPRGPRGPRPQNPRYQRRSDNQQGGQQQGQGQRRYNNQQRNNGQRRQNNNNNNQQQQQQ